VFQGHVEYQVAADNIIKLNGCEFQTNENYKSIIRFPNIGNNIHLRERVNKSQCISSIEKQLNNSKTSSWESKNKKVLMGWVLGSLEEEKKFQEFAGDLKKLNTAVGLDYTNNATLYVLHPDMVDQERRDEWDWTPKYAGANFNGHDEHLLWAICLKDDLRRITTSTIEPEYVGASGSVQLDNYLF